MTVAETSEITAEPAAAAAAPPAGDPTMIGVPAFVVGSIALGLTLVGYVPATAGGAPIAIILAATGIGLLIAMIWAAALGQSAVAGVFGVFSGFWLSYAVLVIGLTHNWFGVAAADAVATQELFLLTWLVVVVVLTIATMRLPFAFTLLFGLIALALLLVLLATANASTSLQTAAGYVVLAFALVGVYLFMSAASAATGGKPYPLGSPLMH
jgi:succinate-acetate transporter protein